MRIIIILLIALSLLGVTPVRAEEPAVVWLYDLSVMKSGNTTALIWETATQYNLIGFNIYRSKTPTGNRVRINSTIIPADEPGSLMGTTYEYKLKNHKGEYYWLELIDIYGGARLFGPVRIERR